MSVQRMLLKQGSAVFRLFKFETRPDGSLLIFLDRDPSPLRGAMSMQDNGAFASNDAALSGKVVPHVKFSCHTTGEVHYYSAGVRNNTHYIQPLHRLSKSAVIGFVSIPRVSKLDVFNSKVHKHDVSAIFEFPENVSERISFALELAPEQPDSLEGYGMAVNYEVYSAVVRLVSPVSQLSRATA